MALEKNHHGEVQEPATDVPGGVRPQVIPVVTTSLVGAHNGDTGVDAGATLAAPAGASKVLIQATVQNVRWTLDGTDPGASKGFQMKAGDPPVVIPIGATETLKVISETTGAKVNYQWLS